MKFFLQGIVLFFVTKISEQLGLVELVLLKI